MALTAGQKTIRDEACRWLRFENQDRDGHSVAADLEREFPDVAEEPAEPASDNETDA
jgi:hypothetical protein